MCICMTKDKYYLQNKLKNKINKLIKITQYNLFILKKLHDFVINEKWAV